MDDISRHIVQAVSIRSEIANRTGVGFDPVIEDGIVATGDTDIVGVGRWIRIIVGAARVDGLGICPGKTMTAGTTARRFLPFGFGRQAKSVGAPVHK